MRRTSFMYILVEERRRHDMRHLSNFHLIDSDEFLLLRCLMALQFFPSNLFALLPTNKNENLIWSSGRQPIGFYQLCTQVVPGVHAQRDAGSWPM